MNQPPRNKQTQNRRRKPPKQRSGDLWRRGAELPAPEPIVPAGDPTAALRSLGEMPLRGQGVLGDHYVAAVVERAAALATALAAAGGLLVEPTVDEVERAP